MGPGVTVTGECTGCLNDGVLLPVEMMTCYGGPIRMRLCYTCRTGGFARWDWGNNYANPMDHWRHLPRVATKGGE